MSGVNHDNRTALHLACHEGNLEIVNHLLLNGVSVHIRDRYDRTPLLEAISADQHEIIQLLINCGAHMTGSMHGIGEQLCAAAACQEPLRRLQSYRLAGVDVAQADPSGLTALHIAALHGKADIVEYLIQQMETIDKKDLLGLTAMDYAERAKREDIIELLSN